MWGDNLPPPPLSCLLFLPPAMGITPILNITSQLILPVYFLIFQGFCVPLWHLLNNLYGDILISTTPSTIMLAQTPNFFLYLLLVITMSHFKGGLALPHILPPTSTTGSKVDNKTACTIYSLLDFVGSPSVGALKSVPLL